MSLVVAVSVTIAIVVAALSLGGHNHSPEPQTPAAPSGPTRRQELRYIQAANIKAQRTAACRTDRSLPKAINGTPSQSLLSILRSIRHPSPTVNTLPSLLTQGVEGIYVKHVRLALSRAGSSYSVVPVASVSNRHRITSRCKAAMTAALHAELPQIPPQLRLPTLRLQAQQQRGVDQFRPPGGFPLDRGPLLRRGCFPPPPRRQGC